MEYFSKINSPNDYDLIESRIFHSETFIFFTPFIIIITSNFHLCANHIGGNFHEPGLDISFMVTRLTGI